MRSLCFSKAILVSFGIWQGAIAQTLPSPQVQTRPGNDNSTYAANTNYVDTALLQIGLSALAYVPVASVQAGSDVTSQLQAAVSAARSANRPLIIPAVSGGACFIVSASIEISQVEIAGDGGCISTSSSVDLFTAGSYGARVHNLKIVHSGTNGRAFNLSDDAHEIYYNSIAATLGSNPDPVMQFSGSNNHIKNNNITNVRSGTFTIKQIKSDPNHISINNEIVGNYMGGSGSGIWIGDNGQTYRPEGTLVALNESVLTGGPFITLSSVLSARIIGNMMDQGSPSGTVRFEPGGYNGYGVDGVLISGNYISAPNAQPIGAAYRSSAMTSLSACRPPISFRVSLRHLRTTICMVSMLETAYL